MKNTKKQWERLWARRYSPFIASIFIIVYQKPSRFFSVCKNKMFVPEGELNAAYFKAKEFSALIKKFTRELFKQNLNLFKKRFEKSFIDYLNSGKQLNKINYSKFTNNQLIKTLKRIHSETASSNEWQISAFVTTKGFINEWRY